MKAHRYWIAIVILTLAVLLVTILASRPVRAAGPWYVAPGGSDSNDCLTAVSPCATINGALGKLTPSDTVLIATGTYTGTGTEVVTLNISAALSGGWDSGFTVQNGMSTIDGQGARRGITVNNGVTATLEHFTARDGSNINGGGIYNEGILTLTNSTISDSKTEGGSGGGITNYGSLALDSSAVSSNTATSDGGGILNLGILIMNDSTVSNNTALESGGIENGAPWTGLSATMTLNNSTVSGNTAQSRGGGVGNYSTGVLNLNNVTVSGNTSIYFPGSGGIFNANGSVTLQNSIVAGNTSSNSSNGQDCFGTISSAGYNLIGNTTSCTFNVTLGDLLNVNANLWPRLIGSPGTHPLLAGSPAINAGNPTGCKDNSGNPLNTDQRGVARVGRCDIGAYEYDPDNYPFKMVFLPFTARNYCAGPFYTDDFSNPASGWPIGNSGNVQYGYLNGEYRILLKNTNWSLLATSGLKASDSILAVDVRNATGVYGSYGLLFGLSDDSSQFYDFEIDPSGNYAIYRLDAGTFTPLAGGFSASIHTGTVANRLKLERNGSLIKAYANGQLLTSISDGSYTGLRRVGLIAFSYDQPNVDVRFDNFKAYAVECQSIATVFSTTNQMTDAADLTTGEPSNSGIATPQRHVRLDALTADDGDRRLSKEPGHRQKEPFVDETAFATIE